MLKRNVLFVSMLLPLLSACGNQPSATATSSAVVSSTEAATHAVSASSVQANAPGGSSQNGSSSELQKAIKDFDLSASQPVGEWKPGGKSISGVRIEGSPSLDTSISLYWPGEDTRPHVVRFDLDATGTGQLQVQLYAGGKPDVLGEQYLVGGNKLYFDLPPHVAGSRVTVTRGPGSAAVSLQGVTVRALVQNGSTNSGSIDNQGK